MLLAGIQKAAATATGKNGAGDGYDGGGGQSFNDLCRNSGICNIVNS